MTSYSQLDRWLHQLVLGNSALAELSFDLENALFTPKAVRRDAVYVTGLARAGTTVLMRALYESNQFSSLTYDDMPFVLAPNIWHRIARIDSKQRLKRERAHGDGIKVDFDSPEALEEVFWRIQCGPDYIQANHLIPHEVSQEVLDKLCQYQSLICRKYNRQRYLAKNNNLMLRLASIENRAKDTTFLILFRHPLDQAASLREQHKNFSTSDTFTHKYMTWLVHHEFGTTHRPFKFLDDECASAELTAGSIEYWLQRWIDAYSYLLALIEKGSPNLIPVCYEILCSDPDYWHSLCQKLDLPQSPSIFKNAGKERTTTGSELLNSALRIYDRLSMLARSHFNANGTKS